MYKIFIPLGVVFGAFAAFLVWQKLEGQRALLEPNYYLSLSKENGGEPLYAGEVLQEGHLATLEVPNSANVFGLDTELIADTPDNRTFFVGKQVNTTIPPGRVLTYDLFEDIEGDRLDLVIPIGKRAISINVNTSNSLNNRVVPGNRIDIVGVTEPIDGTPPQPVMILEDVKVLAVGKALSYEAFQKDEDATYGTITIEVTPEEGQKLAAERARVDDDFILFLRNQCDTREPGATCG